MAIIAIVLLPLVALPAFAGDADLSRRQTEQRQARAMARELVSTVLDLQLRQLEENGLTDLPLYNDIRTMRANIAGLVETEMAAIVEQLAAVEQATGAEREAKFVAARRSIREIVVRLSVERQALLRRLKAAAIAEQVRRLIAMQTEARAATSELPSLPSERRPEATLNVIEDQRDVKGLFLPLTETLADVATWDGPIATAASEGLRTLKEADAGRRLNDADRTLAAAKFAEATEHQETVIVSLRKLLTSIESAQGATDASAHTLADAIEALRDQQQQLRDEIEAQGLKTPPRPEQVEAQQAIAKALAGFSDELAGHPIAAPLRAQAEAAANAATAALFTSNEETTLAQQQRAVDRLTVLGQTLRDEAGEHSRDRSAAELAKTVEDLKQARDELRQAKALHDEAAAQRLDDSQVAAESEKAAAEQAAVIDDGKQLPAALIARLADAADAARRAAEALATEDADSKPSTADAVAAAGDAFQRAGAAIEETLADTARAEAAVRIGELARAAEAIERAAAAERELAATAERAGQSGGLTPQQAGAMQQVQKDVIDVAAKSAEGVQAASPESAEALSKALAAANQVNDALNQTANGGRQPSENDAANPDEPTRGADAPRSPVAAKANETAQHLVEAAAALRREIGLTAHGLADSVDEQLTPVATAQQAVQRAAETLKATPPSTEAAANAAEASSHAEIAATSASQAARKALEGQGTPTDAADALDRATISLAAREQQLRQDQQLARQLAQLAEHQQKASEAIATTRQSLAEAPSDSQAMSPQQREQAKSLHAATRQFAAAQRATGQGAAMISGQQQVMNLPIREALQAAERLPVPQLPGEPVDEQVAEASEEKAPSENGEASEGEKGREGETPSGEPSQQTASSGAEGNKASAASSSPSGMPQPTGLGTGLVPAAPGETARMMAGPEAQAALAAMAAAGMESMEDVAASETASGSELPDGTPMPEGMNDSQAASMKGTVPTEGSPADSDSQTAVAAPRDAAASAANADASWFAKLPPEVRAAIRASSSQPAPKGYEGRLKRYFESVDE